MAQSATVLRRGRALTAPRPEPPRLRGCGPGRSVDEERGSGDQPISSNALPLVSFTNLSTKGIESVAKHA